MRNLFKDIDLQKQFDRDGYVKIPLLSLPEISNLVSYYQEISQTDPVKNGFHISLDNPDITRVKESTERIQNILGPKILPHLDKGKIFTASFTVKEPGSEYIVPPHQDWSFVDEDKFCSATVWVPLQDVNINNGALGIIKGSHKLFKHYRSSPSPQSQSPLTDHIFTLFSYVEVIDLKAGEALVFNNALVHASPPNVSGHRRLAVGIGITQEEAELVHYYQQPESNPARLEIYHVDTDFFVTYNNPKLSDLYEGGMSIASYKKLGETNRNAPKYTEEEITKLILSIPGISKNQVLADKLAPLKNSKFNYMNTQATDQSKKQESTPSTQPVYKDTRTFFQKYTVPNIIAEIKWRLSKKK